MPKRKKNEPLQVYPMKPGKNGTVKRKTEIEVGAFEKDRAKKILMQADELIHAAANMLPPDKRIQKDKYGRILIDGYKGTDPLPENLVMHRQEDKRLLERSMPVRLEPLAQPVDIGPLEKKLAENTEWCDIANEKLKQISENVPQLPFTLTFYGPTGAGKTTTIAYLLEIYEQVFDQIYIFSPTVGSDPTLLNTLWRRDPKCKIVMRKDIDVQMLRDLMKPVEKEYEVLRAVAEQGAFARGNPNPEIDMATKPMDSIAHPFTNSKGEYHGRVPLLPESLGPVDKHDSTVHTKNVNHRTPRFQHSFVKKSSLEVCGSTQLKRLQKGVFVPQHGSKPRPFHKGEAYNYHQQSKHPMKAGAHDFFTTIKNIHLNPQTRHQLLQEHLIKTEAQNPDRPPEKAPTTLVLFDDCYNQIQRFGLTEFVTKLATFNRHARTCMAFGLQKVNGVPTIIRQMATHSFFWQQRSSKSIELMIEEWGGKYGIFPNIEELYYAATNPLGNRKNDFLYLNFRDRLAFRSMQAKLVQDMPKEEDEEKDESNPLNVVSMPVKPSVPKKVGQ